jgi:hypothetical protein
MAMRSSLRSIPGKLQYNKSWSAQNQKRPCHQIFIHQCTHAKCGSRASSITQYPRSWFSRRSNLPAVLGIASDSASQMDLSLFFAQPSADAVLFSCLQHPKRHRAEIRDEPDQPDKDTKLVKVHDHLFILLHEHNGRPDRMDKHQGDGKYS